MAKREPEPEALDDKQHETELPTVGERLRTAREDKGLNLEDVAQQTRIPQRHLASIETADWDNLPAPTYTIGFAKSYASAVGLDRVEIGNQLREEMGGQRFASNATDVFEPADPRRTMPKGLVIGAVLVLIALVVGMSWLNKRSLEQPAPAPAGNGAPTAAGPKPVAAPPALPPQPVAQGPVVLTATAPVWFEVSQKGGPTLFSGTLQPGQTYVVPSTATAPLLKTGKPEGLKVTVGNAVAPPVGPPATTVSKVSLLGSDLMKASARSSASAPPASAPVAGPEPVGRESKPAPIQNNAG